MKWSTKGFESVPIQASANVDVSLPKSAQILIHGRVWAMEPKAQSQFMAMLDGVTVPEAFRLQSEFEEKETAKALKLAEDRKAKGEPDPKPYEVDGKTALIPVSGVMTKKPTSASYMMGGTSTIQTRAKLREARKDADVDYIFMDFETPGGECQGCSELADEIRETAAVKPVIGFVNDQCASAGYFAASQCSALFMNRMGAVGCVGSKFIARDSSRAAAMSGIEVIPFVSEGGIYKAMLTPGTTLTTAQRDEIQREIDHYGNDFKATVQMGRGLSDEAMKEVITAKMFTSEEALALGLIDGIGSYEEILSQVSAGKFAVSPTSDKDNDQARASNRAANGDTMTLDEVKAYLKGLTPQARKEAGIQFEETQQNAQLDAKVTEALGEIAASTAKSQAEAFATGLIQSAKASKGEMDKIVTLYVTALSADGGGIPRFEGGKLIEGANVAAVKDAYNAKTPHQFLNQTIGDLDKGGNFVLGGNGGVEVLDRATMKDLLSRTEEGRNAWAKFEKGAN